MASPRIVGIEWATLEGRRPRSAGCNARLGVHGSNVHVPVVRLTTDAGISGFGYSRAGREQAERLLGHEVERIFSATSGLQPVAAALEYPVLDVVGRLYNRPAYAIAAEVNGLPMPVSLAVPCYDTSLYMDDLDLHAKEDAAKLIADEALAGYARGHRSFKLKVGRGARHMPLDEGTARDIAVIRAVAQAIGPRCTLMIDANNGYNLNLAKRVLEETADCHVYWLEEPFHEDAVLYQDLKAWIAQHNLSTLVADGEGDASPRLLDMAREGLVDVVQYDIIGHGFLNWLRTGQQLDQVHAFSAPHSYGNCYGNYVSGHLAAGITNFAAVEWDEATIPGLDTSAYQIKDGYVTIPLRDGFGIELDGKIFDRARTEGGGLMRL